MSLSTSLDVVSRAEQTASAARQADRSPPRSIQVGHINRLRPDSQNPIPSIDDVAFERVKQQVAPKQFQIFDLYMLKDLPVREVTKLLKVNAAQVYLARHRISALVKKEVARLEAEAEKALGKS